MKASKVIAILAMVLMFLVGCATSEEARQKAQIHLRLGTHHLTQGDSSSALRELLEAEKLDPKDPHIRFALGWAYSAKGRFSQALEQYQEVIKLDPKYTEAYNAMGATYLEMGKWDEAIESFQQALKDLLYLTPFYPLNNIGWAYYKKGDRRKAIEYYRRALSQKPDFGLAHYNLGLAQKDEGKTEEAIASFKAAVTHAPGLLDGHFQLGVLYFHSGKGEEAQKAFGEVLRLAPDSESARLAKQYLDLLKKPPRGSKQSPFLSGPKA